MTAMRLKIVKNRIIEKLTILVLLLLFGYLNSVDVYGQTNQLDTNKSTILVESKRIDYDNALLYANIKIQLELAAKEESVYLILPINETPGLDFYVEPDNYKRTILSGYLEDTGYFVVEILPYPQSGTLNLTLNNVMFSIKETSDEESFGYYELFFGKTKETSFIPSSSIISVDEIRIKDDNVLFTKPASNYIDKNIICLSSSDVDTSIFISKNQSDKRVRSIIIFITLALFIAPGLIAIPNTKYISNSIRKHKKLHVPAGILSIMLFIGTVIAYVFIFIPTNFFDDTTIEATVISGSVCLFYFILITLNAIIIKKQDLPPNAANDPPL